MSKRGLLWGIPALVWLTFTVWYTDFGGPLTDAEIAQALIALERRGMDLERFAQFERFLREDSGNQFLMVNNIDMSEDPPSMPDFGPGATAEDYNNHYMEHMYPQLLSRACHPIFFGNGVGVGIDITGIEGAHGWDLAALFRYKSRRAFVEVVTHPMSFRIGGETEVQVDHLEPRLPATQARRHLGIYNVPVKLC